MWRERFGQVVLAGLGATFFMVGVVGLTSPPALMDPVQIQLGGVGALSEIRAAYGGTHLGLALLFFAGVAHRPWRGAALAVAAVFSGGLVVGRCVSLALDGAPGAFVLRLFVTELLGLNLAVAALLLRRRHQQ